MKDLNHKRSIIRMICVMLLAFVIFVPDITEAAPVTISSGQTRNYTASANGETVTVSLTGASNAVLRGKPYWISVSGKTVTISKNTSTSSRSGDVVFQNGSSGPVYTLRVTQSGAQAQTKTVSVRFNPNGGSGSVTSRTYTIGKSYGSLPSGPTKVGYSFDGWYTSSSGGSKIYTSTTVSASTTNLYAHWKANSYTVSFNSNGGSSVSSKSVTYGSTYGYLSTPTKTNCTFDGWYTAASGGTKVTSSTSVTRTVNHTLYAHWSNKTITVSFYSNGGLSSVSSRKYTLGGTYGSLPAGPTAPTGKVFDGWYTGLTGGTKITASTKVSSVYTILYAHWTAKPITITFNSNGGSSVSNKSVTTGSTYGTLPTPTRDGYDFQGWFTAKSGGTKITASTKVTATSNQTLYAQWKGKSFSVKFNNNGGYGNVPNQSYVVGNKYGSLPTGSTPPNGGLAFDGWYSAASGGTKVTTTTVVNYSWKTLYAHYKAKSFTVSFDSNGGSAVSSKLTVTYNGTYGTLPTTTKTGYNFSGWYTAKSGGTKVTASTKMTATANHTLYAHWTAAQYTVSFNANGGSCSTTSQKATYASTYGTLPIPTRDGYDFLGWYTAKSGGTKITASTKVTITANLTLYAQWKGKTISVKFDNNGGNGNVPNQSYVVGEKYGSLPTGSTPSSGGYKFDGWYTAKSGGTKVSANTIVNYSWKTLYAHYVAKEFTITFKDGNTSISSKKVKYDSTYGDLPTVTKTNHTFQGWYTETSGGTKITASTKVTILANQTLYARWRKNTVTVKFDNNGGSGNVPSQTYNVGEKYGSLPTGSTPPNGGYKFDGWYTAKSGGTKVTISTTVSASVTILYAHYKANSYTVTFNSAGGDVVSSISVTYDRTYGDLPQVKRYGYIFEGWYTKASGGTKVTTSTKVTAMSNHTLYAHWKYNMVTVKFDNNGGKGNVPSKSYEIGSKYGSLPAGSNAPAVNLKFDGWYTAKNDGTKITADTIVLASYTTLYAHYVFDPNAFFNANKRFKPADKAKTIPYNSGIEDSKKIGTEEYEYIYETRSAKYNTKNLSRDEYMKDIRKRAAELQVIGVGGAIFQVTPTANLLLQHYFNGKGKYYEYDATPYVLNNSIGSPEYIKAATLLMRQMEKYLIKGEKITFVDRNSHSNPLEYTMSSKYDITAINAYVGVKGCSTGVSGSCTFDGSTYKMDLYFYVQDYYDFYYSDTDTNSQADCPMFTVYNDELAFLVLAGKAAPYESCGVFHTSIEWKEGQPIKLVGTGLIDNSIMEYPGYAKVKWKSK